MRLRPGNRLRANTHASPEPAINAISVAAVATAKESLMGNQLIAGVSQHDTRKQCPDNYSAEFPLQIGGRVVRSPDAVTAEIDLIPQLDDLVDRRQAKHDRSGEECSELERQSKPALLQDAPGEPNDDRADEHLDHHVCKLVVLHWTKLPAVPAEKVSEC